MFGYENFEKNAVFLFIRMQYLAIFRYLKKSASRFTCHHSRNTFWLGLLARIITNHKEQKITHPCFAGKMFGRKMHFFKIWRNTIFQFLRQNFCQKHFESVPFEKRWKILKKSIFLIKTLSTFCGISVNILNCHNFFPLHFYSKIGSILQNVNVNMFCEFQIFSLYGTSGMGLRRRKMIKTSKKTFLPGPPKTCWVFLPTFLKSFRYGWILYAEWIFCCVLFSLHRSLNKTTVLQQDCFFPCLTSQKRVAKKNSTIPETF